MTSLVWRQLVELRDMEQRAPGAGVGSVDVVIQAAAQQQSFKSTQPNQNQKGADGDLDPEATGSIRYEHMVCLFSTILSNIVRRQSERAEVRFPSWTLFDYIFVW